MKNRYIIYIAIAVVCIISIVTGVYFQVFSEKPEKPEATNEVVVKPTDNDTDDPEELKQEFNSLFDNSFYDQGNDTTGITKIEGLEDQDIIYAAYSFTDEKDEVYSIDINLPVFNVDGEVPAEFNNTTQTVFANKANDILSKTDKYTIYNVEYVAYLNDNILSLVIKSTLKEGNSAQRVIVQTYNYDIETGEKLTLNDVLDSQGYVLKDVNKKISAQVKEANKQAQAISEAMAMSGQNVYERDIDNAMYVTDNVNHFFLGEDGQIYIVYPYGNTNFTSEMDIIKL